MSTETNPVVNIEEVEEQKAPSAPNRLKRVKLIVAYDGTNYHGWQVQPNGETIEGVLNRTLSSLLGEKIVVTGASRTDAGVHSMGNVAVFDTKSRIPAEKISCIESGPAYTAVWCIEIESVTGKQNAPKA